MEPSLALVNANIYTMDDSNPRAEAVALYDSRIIAVGSNEEIMGLIGPATKVYELCGKTVIPGIIDAHFHLLSYALRAREVNLDGITSLEEGLSRIRDRVVKTKPGSWITGGGWDKNLWEGVCLPDKRDLDMVSPNNPLALCSKDGHTLWVNSTALKEASIKRDTSNPEGGEIVRDPETGEATGILKEKAMEFVETIIPKKTFEEMEVALKEAIRVAQSHGITSVHVPEKRNAFLTFQSLQSKGELGLRVYMMIPAESLDSAIQLGIKSGFGNEKLKMGVVKIFADGALGSQTAAMLEPYEGDPRNRGILVTSKDEIRELMLKASHNCLGIAVHAIGDRANKMVLDIIEEVAKTDSGRKVRYRIEHAQHIRPEDVGKFGKLGVIASIQPTHISLDMDIADRHLGRRSKQAYPLRSLLDTGIVLAFGSDCPVVAMDPILGIYSAVTRKKVDGHPSDGWHPKEQITVEEALKAYTIGAAYASGEEEVKGSIKVGKLADLVVLSKNIFEAPEEELLSTKADITIFNGEIVYIRQTEGENAR